MAKSRSVIRKSDPRALSFASLRSATANPRNARCPEGLSKNKGRTQKEPDGFDRRLLGTQELMQMQMNRSQVAAIIAGRDADDAGPAGGVDARAHGVLDGSLL